MAPEAPIIVRSEVDGPQPRLDRIEGNGMSVVVGRVRILDDVLAYLVLGHNLIRGAVRIAITATEALHVEGYL